MAAGDIPPGRPGNLTSEQEESLRKLWALVLRICNVGDGELDHDLPHIQARSASSELATEKAKKKKPSFFSRRGNIASHNETADSPISEVAAAGNPDFDDKYGQNKQFHETIARQSPESIRDTIWSMVKHDDPDALLLRFLRARKWDVEKALVMLISTMNWRAMEMHVDDDIMKHGEAAAVEAETSGDEFSKKLGHGFLAQMRMGKSFLHGSDKEGRPICFVRVRLHRQGEHAEEALERNTVYIIETARMLLRPPIDTATIIFDMTGFSLANMDYTPVKFMIKCFEANYPESLGAVLVYKAPWVFQGIWKIIRGWLDPVVASKVHFLNSANEMASYVDLERLPKEVDGKEDWEYRYIEPLDGENRLMADTATRDRLLETRRGLVEEYERATQSWAQSATPAEAQGHQAARATTAERLRTNYWELDPYLRARSLYDRLGMIKSGGMIDLYPAAAGTSASVVAHEPSADDVD